MADVELSPNTAPSTEEQALINEFLETAPRNQDGSYIVSKSAFQQFVGNKLGGDFMEGFEGSKAPLAQPGDAANMLGAAAELGVSVAAPELAGIKLLKGGGFLKNLYQLSKGGIVSAGAEEIARQAVTEPLGLKTADTSLMEGASNFASNAAVGTGIGAVPLLLGTAAKRLAAAYPENKYTRWLQANEEGGIAAVFNAPSRRTAREANLVEDVMVHEDKILQLDPSKGIDFEAPGAIRQFLGRIKKIKDDALATKNEAFILADQNRRAAGAKKLFFPKSEADQIIADNGFTDETAAAFNNLYTEMLAVKGKVKASPKGVQLYDYPMKEVQAAKHFTATQAQKMLRNIDDKLRATGYYDDAFQAKIATDPSTLAKSMAEINSLRAMRKYVSGKLNTYAADILDKTGNNGSVIATSNETVAAMIDFGELVKRFQVESLEGFTPGAAKSLSNSVKEPGDIYPLIDEIVFGGMLSDAAKNRQIAKAGRRNTEALQLFQDLSKWKGQKMPMGLRVGQSLFERGVTGVTVPFGVNVENIRSLYDPKVLDALKEYIPDVSLHEELDQAANSSHEVQLQTFGKLKMALKDQNVFEPSPIPGVHTMIPTNEENKSYYVTDKFEREGLRQQIATRVSDIAKQYKLIQSLNENNILTEIPKELIVPQAKPLPGPSTGSSNNNSVKKVESDLQNIDTVSVSDSASRVDHGY